MKMSKLFIIYIYFILNYLIHLIYSDSNECEISFYSEITYSRTEMLSNGYKLMVSAEGIYSFIPSLSRTIYSYNFTEEQKITENANDEIYQSQICQFSNESGGEEYVLCYAKNSIYVLNKTGKMLFFDKLNYTISHSNSVSLICNRYEKETQRYIFFIIYNSLNDVTSKLIINGYYLFFTSENQGYLTIFHNITHFPSENLDGYYINGGGISCEMMQKESSNIMTCFIPITIPFNQKILGSFLFDSNTFEISKETTLENDQVKHISSSIGNNKSKALVCYLDSSGNFKCYSYDINEQKFSENELVSIPCIPCQIEYSLIKTFYFPDTNEFIISCVNSVPTYYMRRIDHNFNVVEEEEYVEEAKFNCYNMFSYSVVYVNKYKDYILIIYSICDNNYQYGVRFFELSKDCDIGNIKGATDDWEEENENNILTHLKLNTDLFPTSSKSYSYIINDSVIKKNSNKLSELININTIKQTEIFEDEEDLSEKSTYTHPINTQEIKYSDNIKKTNIENIETNRITIIDSVYKTEKTQEEKIISENLEEDIKSDYSHEQISFTNSDIISSLPEIQITYSKTNAMEFQSDNITERINQLKSDGDNEKTENFSFSDKKTDVLNFETSKKTNEFFITDSTKEEINKSNYISQNIIINDETSKIDISTQIKTYAEDTKNVKIESDVVDQSENKKISENCLCNEDFPYLLSPSQQCTNLCSVEQLLDQTCKVDCVSDESFRTLIQNLETLISDASFDDDKEIVIVGNNVICDITTTKNKQTYNNISYIDFGECETKLKQKFNINYLLIIKFDKINKDLPTSVEYEVYDPEKKSKLDLSICNSDKISIDIPMTLDEHSLNLYKNLSSLGYDIFNKSDRFYNDICTIFSSNDDTDVLLIDRRATYYNDSIIFCENGCDYSGYNPQTKFVKCKCKVKNKINPNINYIGFETNNVSSFFDIKTYMNLEVIKCYKLLFCKNGFIKNYGNYIILLMIFIYLIIMILFYLNYKKIIRNLILQVHPKYNFDKISIPPIKLRKSTKSNKYKDNSSKEKIIKKNKLNKSKTKTENKNKNKNKKNTKTKEKNINVYKINTKERSLDSSLKKFKITSPKVKKNKSKLKLINQEIKIYKKKDDKPSLINMNDEEMNYLSYKEAISLDKRSYCQYYFSLLKKKHLILFTFIAQNDYNLIYIKLCLFIISFCLYFTVSAFFYTDKTMHKVYQSKGKYDFIFQLPKIFYSSFITFIINTIIKTLALSEKNILYLKQFKDKKKLNRKIKEVLKCLEIKFNIFFIIGFIFLCIFWYYISVFCSVYVNTQIILIKNTILSFGLSLIYPFFLNLLPGFFRFPSLKSRKSPYIYKFGNIISLL